MFLSPNRRGIRGSIRTRFWPNGRGLTGLLIAIVLLAQSAGVALAQNFEPAPTSTSQTQATSLQNFSGVLYVVHGTPAPHSRAKIND